MTDISKCNGTNCTLKNNCYRFTAKADEFLQSYGVFTQDKEGKCEYFWDIKK